MLGLIAYQYDWDFDKAVREYKRAQELDPTLVHQWYGSYLQALNRIPEAEIEFKRFADFQPFLLSGNTTYGQYFFLTRQYDRAARANPSDARNGRELPSGAGDARVDLRATGPN